MHIGFDLDDVLVDFIPGLCSFYNAREGTSFKKDDFKSYNLAWIFGISEEKLRSVLADYYQSSSLMARPPSKDAVDVVTGLLDSGNELSIVTSRASDFAMESTLEWLDSNFPKHAFKEVFFMYARFEDDPVAASKAHVARARGMSVFMDDSYRVVDGCAKIGIQAFLMDQPWNRQWEQNGFKRIYSLQEIAIDRINGA